MYYNFTDQGIFQISKVLYNQFLSQKNLKQLDIDRLDQFKRQYIKPLYPHKQSMVNGTKILQKYACNQYCCKLNPGRFCCCSTTQPDKQYKQFGLGVCLYTKFIKHMALFLFLISLLAIVSVGIYQFVGYSVGYHATQSYQDALYSTTIGTLSSQSVKCGYSQINGHIANFQLNCQVGQIQLLKPVLTYQTLSTLLNCRKQHRKVQQNAYIPQYSVTDLSPPSSSTSTSTKSLQVSITSQSYNGQSYPYLSYTYQCIKSTYGATQITQPIIIYITVGIDIVIVLAFIVFLISQHKAQSKEIQHFKLGELAIHDFTVKVGGFYFQQFQQQFQYFINGYDRMRDRYYIADASNNNNNNNTNSLLYDIVQIKIPQVQQIRQTIQCRRYYYEQLYNLIQYCFFEDGIDLNRYQNSSDFIRKCYGTANSAQYKQYKKQLTQLIEQFISAKKTNHPDLKQLSFSILLVLSNPKYKKLMLRNAKHNCCSNYIKIGHKKYHVSEPPVADMVIWQNKYKHTFIRVVVAWIITLAICFCSYLLVAFATFKQQQLRNNKFNINCGLFYKSVDLQAWSAGLFSGAQDRYLHCYCNYNYFSLSYKDSNMRQTCSVWFSQYLVYYSLPVIISIGIVVYNIIVSRIFRVLSKFQAHTLLSTQLYSYIIKRSFMLILNMGLIVILIKINYHASVDIENLSFLFMGIYNDITSDWYLQIGVIIMLTLAINILMPIFDMVLVSVLKCMKKCWDRRCFCRKTSQKTKKGYIQLYSNDVFPIEQRYSDFIAMIVITLAFSAVMPILYVISFLSIWFMFICDKLLLFRVYQKPINYTKDLQYNVFKIVYIALMLHCVASAFMLSQSNLVFGVQNVKDKTRFNLILTTPYLIPYVVIFLLLAGWVVFYSVIIKFCNYCFKKCQRQVSKIYKSKFHQNFYGALNQYQINRLKMSVEMQLQNTISSSNINIQNTNKKPYTRIICQNTLNQLNKAEKIKKQTVNQQSNIRLIGRAGYQEMFDDQIFYRERKINAIDYQIRQIVKVEKQLKRDLNRQIQNTVCQINL